MQRLQCAVGALLPLLGTSHCAFLFARRHVGDAAPPLSLAYAASLRVYGWMVFCFYFVAATLAMYAVVLAGLLAVRRLDEAAFRAAMVAVMYPLSGVHLVAHAALFAGPLALLLAMSLLQHDRRKTKEEAQSDLVFSFDMAFVTFAVAYVALVGVRLGGAS